MFKQTSHGCLEIPGHFQGEVHLGKPSPLADFTVVILGREGEKSKIAGRRRAEAGKEPGWEASILLAHRQDMQSL